MIEKVFTYSDNINCIHVNKAGAWVGHLGGLSFSSTNGKSRKWTTADGLPAHPVLHLAQDGDRLAVATPNGVAWTEDYADLLSDHASKMPWKRGLMHPKGSGAYVNGVSFVDGRIYATTGGGRIYLEGDQGFQLLELPLPQARLLRVMALETSPGRRRLLVVTNNSGMLLLATGDGEESSLYQWGEDEGLASRYVTTIERAGDYVVIGVHGCVHVARVQDLVENPDAVARWGRIVLSDLTGPSEHTRIHSLCKHGDYLYIGSSAGLYRVSVAELEIAYRDRIGANRVDENPVRHLGSFGDHLWGVQHSDFGRFLEGDSKPQRVAAKAGRAASYGGDEEVAAVRPRIVSFGRRWRFLPEQRWRGYHEEPECRGVNTMISTEEGLVIGGDAGRVVRRSGDQWITEVISRTRRAPEIHSIALDPDGGNLWTATRYGLFQRDSRSRWQRDTAFPGRTVHQLAVWRGSMIALGSAGLHVYAQGGWTEVTLGEDTPALFSACSGAFGLVLAAKPGSGFYLWRPDATMPKPWDLRVGRANCMAWGEDGELWLGTDRGLLCWKADQLQEYSWNSEREDHVQALLVHDGRLLVGSQAGLWIGPKQPQATRGEDLEAAGQRYGLLEGLPNTSITSIVLHQGRVWVGTQGGLVQLAH